MVNASLTALVLVGNLYVATDAAHLRSRLRHGHLRTNESSEGCFSRACAIEEGAGEESEGVAFGDGSGTWCSSLDGEKKLSLEDAMKECATGSFQHMQAPCVGVVVNAPQPGEEGGAYGKYTTCWFQEPEGHIAWQVALKPVPAEEGASEEWTTIVATSGGGKTKETDLGEAKFDEMFAACPVVRYSRNGAVHSVYVRKTPYGDSAYKLFTDTWRNSCNKMGQDFEMYSSIAMEDKWSFCNYNDPDVAYPRDCGKNGAVAWQWFSMPGGRFTNRFDASFEIYTGESCPAPESTQAEPEMEGWTTAVSLSSDGRTVGTDIGKDEFNAMFAACPVVRYRRNGATHSVYVREKKYEGDAFDLFTHTWRSESNSLNADFKLYSSMADLASGSDAWQFCNYNDPDVGFPRDCGPTGPVGSQWFSMPGDRFTLSLCHGAAFDIFTGDSCPAPAEAMPEPMEGWTPAVVLSDSGSEVSSNIGEEEFNAKFKACPVVRYRRNGVVHSIYERKTPIAVNAFKMFTDTWSSKCNRLDQDFELFSSMGDMEADKNRWTFCNFDDPDVAYPRDCGPTGGVGNQWFTMPGGRFNARGLASGAAFDVYSGETCPVAIEAPTAPDATGWTNVLTMSVDGSELTKDDGEEEFNRLFAACPVVRYVKNGEVHSVYVRQTPVAINSYQVFTATWASEHNLLNTDFSLYSTMQNAKDDHGRWTFCNYDDPDVGYPRDCGVTEFAAHRWFSKPGGLHEMADVCTGASFDIYTGDGCPAPASAQPLPMDGWTQAVLFTGTGTTAAEGNMDAVAFNTLFKTCPVVRYRRNGGVHSVYVRRTKLTDSTDTPIIDAFKLFTDTWESKSNVLNTDFKMYSSLADAASDREPWQFCNYNDPDVGYPRDCGKASAVASQWFSMPGGHQSRGITTGVAFDVYSGADCPARLVEPVESLVYLRTLQQSGCPNPSLACSDASSCEWLTMYRERVLTDMFALCDATKKGQATEEQKSRCCGPDGCEEPEALHCQLQTEWALRSDVYRCTFQQTGCPSTNVNCGRDCWWRKHTPRQVFSDMHSYCEQARTGSEAEQHFCCGPDGCPETMKCKQQEDFVHECTLPEHTGQEVQPTVNFQVAVELEKDGQGDEATSSAPVDPEDPFGSSTGNATNPVEESVDEVEESSEETTETVETTETAVVDANETIVEESLGLPDPNRGEQGAAQKPGELQPPHDTEHGKDLDTRSRNTFLQHCVVLTSVTKRKMLPVEVINKVCEGFKSRAVQCKLRLIEPLKEAYARKTTRAMQDFCEDAWDYSQDQFGKNCATQCDKKMCKPTCEWLESKKLLDGEKEQHDTDSEAVDGVNKEYMHVKEELATGIVAATEKERQLERLKTKFSLAVDSAAEASQYWEQQSSKTRNATETVARLVAEHADAKADVAEGDELHAQKQKICDELALQAQMLREDKERLDQKAGEASETLAGVQAKLDTAAGERQEILDASEVLAQGKDAQQTEMRVAHNDMINRKQNFEKALFQLQNALNNTCETHVSSKWVQSFLTVASTVPAPAPAADCETNEEITSLEDLVDQMHKRYETANGTFWTQERELGRAEQSWNHTLEDFQRKTTELEALEDRAEAANFTLQTLLADAAAKDEGAKEKFNETDACLQEGGVLTEALSKARAAVDKADRTLELAKKYLAESEEELEKFEDRYTKAFQAQQSAARARDAKERELKIEHETVISTEENLDRQRVAWETSAGLLVARQKNLAARARVHARIIPEIVKQHGLAK